MYCVLAHLTIQPHRVDEFLTLFRDHVRETLREEVRTFGLEIIQDETTPNHFYFYETYADEAAFHAHMQGAVGARNFPRITALVSGKVDESIYIGKGINLSSPKT